MRKYLGHLLVVASLAATSLAQSEPLKPATQDPAVEAEHRSNYERGRLYVQAKNWNEARRIFIELWHHRQTYDVALFLGQIEVNLGLFRDAAEHLNFGLRHLAPREDPKTVARARRLLEVVKGHVATVEVRSNRRGAKISIEGRRAGETPLKTDLFLNPGFYLIEANFEQDQVRRQLQAERGVRHVIDLNFHGLPVGSGLEVGKAPDRRPVTTDQPASLAHDAAPPTEGRLNLVPVYIGAGLALASVAGGIGFGMAANAAESDLRDFNKRVSSNACVDGSALPGECRDARSARERQRRNADRSTVAFSIAGGLAAASVLYVLFWPRTSERSLAAHRAPPVRATVTLEPRGGILAVGANF